MASSAFIYNSKTVLLTRPPDILLIDPRPPRAINTTLTGATDTILKPRVDTRVSLSFPKSTDTALRVQLDNVRQWLLQGNSARFVMDTDKQVSTTLSSTKAAGQTTIGLASVASIAARNFVMISGPYYQLVTVDSVGASTVHITSSLDNQHVSGSKFRDELLWDFTIRDPDQPGPIRDVVNPHGGFEWSLDLVEDS